MATPIGNAVPVSTDPFVAGLAQGGKWVFSGAPVLTYSEHNDPPIASYWSAGLADVFAQAFSTWASVANVSFSPVSGPPDLTQTGADIALSLFSAPSAASLVALSFFPDPVFADQVLSEAGLSRLDWPRPEGDMNFNVASDLQFQNYIQPGGVARWVALHESGHALGLKHPFDDGANGRPTFSQLGIAAYDDDLWTVMSFDSLNRPSLALGHAATPMPLDIKAVQAIYGANTSYHADNDVYHLLDDGALRTIWDAGGADTLDASGLATGATLTLAPGGFSISGANSYTAIAFDVVIENAVGSNLGDTIVGNGAANRLEGGGGDDTITGGSGNDSLDGGAGGSDVAIYAAGRSACTALRAPDGAMVVGLDGCGGDGLDRVWNVEAVRFAGGTVASSAADSALEYVASYSDLMAALGANAAAALDHFASAGWYEGRKVSFNGLEYTASYGDLMNAFGANDAAGAAHYVVAGRFEGRTTSFDGLEYIASYGDLIRAFGANDDAGAGHYIQAGRFEGRAASFDGLEYIASYGDLISAFQNQIAANPNHDIGSNHYIAAGYSEERHVTFDGLEYIASYSDLINAFHDEVVASASPEDIGANHYILAGNAEHRAPDLFDAAQYLAKYTDLQAAFGTDTEAATIHYITNGYFEHRTDDPLI
jgi:hypothetical protein